MEYFKVLVVHRQEGMLEEIKSILEKFEPCLRGYHCGIDGLHAAKVEHFDLILCGTDLPLITGFEMIRAIRNLSRNCLTPAILIAKHLTENQSLLSRKLGAVAITAEKNLIANLNFVFDHTKALNNYYEFKPSQSKAFKS